MNGLEALGIVLSAPETSASHMRMNMVISAWACLLLGAGIIFGTNGDAFALAVGAPISIAGVILLVFALGIPSEVTVDPDELAAWAPDAV